MLIIKAAWGGKSLGGDFLPPSSGSTPATAAEGDPPHQLLYQSLPLQPAFLRFTSDPENGPWLSPIGALRNEDGSQLEWFVPAPASPLGFYRVEDQ